MDELLQQTVDMLIDLDEPEQILPTLRKAAQRRKGERWRALARVLADAEFQLDAILNGKPAGPDFTSTEPTTLETFHSPETVNTDGEAKSA